MKRWALRIVVFLFLGAIVNVAVAWGCVLPLNPATYEHLSQILEIGPGRTAMEIDWWRRRGHSQVQRVWRDDVFERGNPSGERSPPDGPRLEVEAGWPLFAIRCAGFNTGEAFSMSSFLARESLTGIRRIEGGIYVTFRQGVEGPQCLVLPLTPLWPGFAINTVFYAVVLWLLFAAPFTLRRRRRIRRGLCPKCAYDLRGTQEGTACPECGTTR